MTKLRRAVIAISATTAVAGSGLVLASEASAAPPPASWDCQTYTTAGGSIYGVQCFKAPAGRKYRLVLNCRNFPGNSVTPYTGPVVDRNSGSELKATICTGHDGTITTWGARVV